jgi:hypothetical protein
MRLARLATKLRTALSLWRRGGLAAVDHRAVELLRARLGLDSLDARTATLATLRPELDRLGAELGRALDLTQRVDRLEAEVERRTTDLTQAVGRLEAELGRRSAELGRTQTLLQLALDAFTFMSWVEQEELRSAPLVSVVIPTRDRATCLPRAIASVRAQTYPSWEIVVVDDASDDDTSAVLAHLAGELGSRLKTIRLPRSSGSCAARNRGLAIARGSIVTYLDDDNSYHPSWLKSVAWAFEQRPDVDALYGGFIVDDERRVNGKDSGSLPRLFVFPFDAHLLTLHNFADTSTIAHRAGLPHAVWDEALREMGDWDILVRLSAEREPMLLPAVACFYRTDAPHRLSGGPTYDVDAAAVRRRAARLLRADRPAP